MRIGLLDIAAAGLVVALLVIPTPPSHFVPVYRDLPFSAVESIAEAQAAVLRRPEDGRAVERLAELLVFAGESDWAMRVAGAGILRQGPEEWRGYAAVSNVHADRLEIHYACNYAEEALRRCTANPKICTPMERARLETYVTALRAGVDSGADPKWDFETFYDAIRRQVPTIHTNPSRPATMQ
jgi:hypothetical protein